MFAEITAAAADYEQSNRTHPMPRQQGQLGNAAAQNWSICPQVPCRGRPTVNREYSAIRNSAGSAAITVSKLLAGGCGDRAQSEMMTGASAEGMVMLGIEALDGASVEGAGALVACEQAAARRVRPQLPAEGFAVDPDLADPTGVLARTVPPICSVIL